MSETEKPAEPMVDGESGKDENELDMWVVDAHDNPLMDTYELDGTFVGNATPDELHEYLRRALLQSPAKIVFEVGKKVAIMRPISVREFLGCNPHIVKAVKLQTGVQPSQVVEAALIVPTDEEAAAQLAKEDGISKEDALAEIKKIKNKLREKGTNEG